MLAPVFHQSAAESGDLAPLRVCSIDYQTHGLAGLAALAATPGSAAALSAALTTRGIDAVVLTTCNRLELYWRSRAAEDDREAIGLLASAVGSLSEAVVGRSRSLSGDAAAIHLFRVCAGLESLVLGEAEVLGQVRAALDASPGAGPLLAGVFRAAVRAAGAARAETAIGKGAISVASTAVQRLSAHIPVSGCRVLVVGAGDTARKTARHLRAIGVGSLVVTNRTRSRADNLAVSVNAAVAEWDTLPNELLRADAVISAVSTPEWVVTLEHLRERARVRERSPFVAVDLSMPPSIEPGDVEHIVRIDLTALGQTASANRWQREAEVPRVEAVIARELEWLRRWARREALRPVKARPRAHPESVS